MLFQVRPYAAQEFQLISTWWDVAGEVAPTPEMLPEESTFILEMGRAPALCVTLYLIQYTTIASVENFIGNPALKGENRREGTIYLLEYLKAFAKSRGYSRLFCLSHREALRKRYLELGFTQTAEGLTSFILEI